RVLFRSKVRFIGDPVAAVAAIDEDVALDALNLSEVEYEPLQTMSSIEEGVMIDESRIHEYGDGGNVHKKVSLEFGETDEGFAEADLIREDTFFYEGNTHLPMEQHAAVAHFDADEKLTLWSSTQTPHYVHRALTKVLEIPASHIRVIATPNGGGFGGQTAPFHNGALQTVTYEVPRYKFDGVRVFTNKPPCGPKRGHGTPQPRYALEVHLDKIAEQLDLDPSEIRRNHLVKPNSVTANYLRIGSMGLGACIDKVVEGSDWKNKFSRVSEPGAVATGSSDLMAVIDPVATARGSDTRKLPFGKGIGIACSSYICGAGLPIYWNNMPQSGVQLRLDRQGGVCVMCGSTDIGQGSDSILAYIVAEVLGIDPFDIRVVTADTDLTH